MYVKLFEDFDFINEAVLSQHYIERVSSRIQELTFKDTGNYKKSPAFALERCKKALLKKLSILERKSYPGDSILRIENFGEIVMKDSKGTYRPTFSTDNGAYVGKTFIALVFNNLLITTYLVAGENTPSAIKQVTLEHMNKKYGDYRKKLRDTDHIYLDGQQTIIDLDMSDADFDVKFGIREVVKTVVSMPKQTKEMTLTKGHDLTFIGKDSGVEVYKKKTIADVTFTNKKTMLVKFTDNLVKTFVIDGEKIQKKFIVTPNSTADKKFYIGDIQEMGIKQGKNVVKISVSQVLDDLGLGTPPVE